MKTLRNLMLMAAAVTLLSGCLQGWVRVDDAATTVTAQGRFSLELPAGWVRNKLTNSGLYATRDGGFQYLAAAHHEPEQAFPNLGKASAADMLAPELAELAIAELKQDSDWANLKLVSNRPAMLDGRPGFRLHVRRHSERGLRIDRVIYGAADASGYYALVYEAPNLHYFERDLPVFESVVQSFRSTGEAV